MQSQPMWRGSWLFEMTELLSLDRKTTHTLVRVAPVVAVNTILVRQSRIYRCTPGVKSMVKLPGIRVPFCQHSKVHPDISPRNVPFESIEHNYPAAHINNPKVARLQQPHSLQTVACKSLSPSLNSVPLRVPDPLTRFSNDASTSSSSGLETPVFCSHALQRIRHIRRRTFARQNGQSILELERQIEYQYYYNVLRVAKANTATDMNK